MVPKHFLDIDALDTKTLRAIIDWAHEIKRKGHVPKRLKRRERPVLAMIFEKPSTRTRVSFEVAIYQLGGQSLVLSPQEFNKQTGLAMTCPATSQVEDRDWSFAVLLKKGVLPPKSGRDVDSAILVDQARAIDFRARGMKKVADCPKDVLDEVTEILLPIVDPQAF